MLDIREKFVMEKVVNHWNRLCRAVVKSQSLEKLKNHVDVLLGDTV